MTSRDLREALRDADAVLKEHPGKPAAGRRLRRRLSERASRPTFGWFRSPPAWAAVGAAAAAVVLAAILWPSAEQGSVPRSDLGGLTLASASPDLVVREGPGRLVEVNGGRCLLVDQPRGIGMRLGAGAAVRREGRGLRVVRGRARFAVLRRPVGKSAVRVLVSHGAIEIVGTVFTVVQGGRGGRVTLHEGAIRFAWADGRVDALAPGDSLSWPRATPALLPKRSGAAQRRPRRRARSRKRTRRRSLSRLRVPADARRDAPAVQPILRRVAILRSRGDYSGAAAELARALGLSLRRVTRERLSFELGAILTYQVRNRALACTHWRSHRRRHAGGRYEPEIQEALTSLGCRGGR